jgi:hypothetical protein
MSTLVSILLAIVLNALSGGDIDHKSKDISKAEIVQCEQSFETIETYLIIKDEQLFHKK